MLALVYLVISDLYLFHLTVLLNYDFSCFKNLLSISVDRVTTDTCNFASFILNVAFDGVFITGIAGSALGLLAVCVIISIKTQFLDQVKVRDTLQLLKGMSKVLQQLP